MFIKDDKGLIANNHNKISVIIRKNIVQMGDVVTSSLFYTRSEL